MYTVYSEELDKYLKIERDKSSLKAWIDRLQSFPCYKWVEIIAGDDLAGFVIFNADEPNMDIYVEDLYIKPEYRRNGLATTYILKYFELLKDKRIGLSVIKNNFPAMQFWLNIFNELGINPEINQGDYLIDFVFDLR